MMTFEHPWAETAAGLSILLFIAVIAHFVVRFLLLKLLHKLAHLLPGSAGELVTEKGVLRRITYVIPLMVFTVGFDIVPGISDTIVGIITTIAQSLILVVFAWTISAVLNVVNELYDRRPDSAGRSIKGYLQLVMIIIGLVIGLLILGIVLDRDILTLLAGLGAVTAVIMLIFQSTILSFVASIQVSSYDMVRVGDWIEMPALNADGDVIDISLHTIKVQNWDKTITTIPTNRLMTDTFKNWRGMFDTEGRRIKRSLLIDQTSVRFLTEEERKRMHDFFLIDEYMKNKEKELSEWNAKLKDYGKEPVNTRRVTNLGTFRAYVIQYLDNHPDLNHNLLKFVRHQDPTAEGIPMEIWCFTASTSILVYESVQADIFDHLLAIMPEFGLRIFQHPSGADWRESMASGKEDA